MNLSIIIPNYNGESLLTKNLPGVLESLAGYKNGNVEIIIADDPSTDNSKKVIDHFINSIKQKNIICKTVENKDQKKAGFSKNVNRAVKFATGEILILLNTDVYPRKDFLKFLLPYFKDQEIFAVGCMDESIEGGQKILRGRGIGAWRKGFLMHSKGDVNKSTTLWVNGGSGAFSKKIWDELGGLEEAYNPFYWEDIDLSYRAQKSGYKIIFEKQSKVVHEHGKGAIKTFFNSGRVNSVSYRNQFIFVWLNITDIHLILSHVLWLPYHLVNALIKKDTVFLSGFITAVFKIPYILKKRKLYTNRFTRSDKEILSEFKT